MAELYVAQEQVGLVQGLVVAWVLLVVQGLGEAWVLLVAQGAKKGSLNSSCR